MFIQFLGVAFKVPSCGDLTAVPKPVSSEIGVIPMCSSVKCQDEENSFCTLNSLVFNENAALSNVLLWAAL